MGLADALQREIDNKRTDSPARLRAFERTEDVVKILGGDVQDLPTSIALDMFIAFREPFHGGWMLWLGSEEVLKLTPEQKAELPNLTFDEKAKHLFRLPLWTKNKRSIDAIDIIDIPDGAEIYVERVAGLKLFVASQLSAKLAEGNASRVEVVTKMDDNDSEGDDTGDHVAVNSQTTEGTDSEGTLTQPKEKQAVLNIANADTACSSGDIEGMPAKGKVKSKAQKKVRHQ